MAGQSDQAPKINFAYILMLIISIGIISFDIIYYTRLINQDTLLSKNFIYPVLQKLYRTNQLNFYYLKLLSVFIAISSTLLFKMKKSLKINKQTATILTIVSLLQLSFLMIWSYLMSDDSHILITDIIYLIISYSMIFCSFISAVFIRRILSDQDGKDKYNLENESWAQNTTYYKGEEVINIPMEFYYKRKMNPGYLTIYKPFRSTLNVGIPGIGKSFAFIEEYMIQALKKDFCGIVYDFKFNTLTDFTYGILKEYGKEIKTKKKLYVLNFENLEYSHRCNPIDPQYIKTADDALTAAKVLAFNINRDWIKKESEFFAGSAISLIRIGIWYLRERGAELGKDLCTIPHLIVLLNKPDSEIFPIFMKYKNISLMAGAFADALQKEAYDQLAGQTASAKIPLSALISKEFFWTTSGNDFNLDINDPKEPKILCIGNSPKNDTVYTPIIGLYMQTTLDIMNAQKKHKSMVILDESPTAYIHNLRKTIDTGRSNKIALLISVQSIPQLDLGYTKEVAKIIKDNVGNVVGGTSKEETAKYLQNVIGKSKQKQVSTTINSESTSQSISYKQEYMLPDYKVSSLGTGYLCGIVADDFDNEQDFEKKRFNCRVKVDIDERNRIKKHKLPVINKDFLDPEKKDKLLTTNFNRILDDIDDLIFLEQKRHGLLPEIEEE